MSYLYPDMEIDELLSELKDDEDAIINMRAYLQKNCDNQYIESLPNNKEYLFYTLEDISNNMEDYAQIERFLLELPYMINIKKWYNRICEIKWCDNGIYKHNIESSPSIQFFNILLILGLGIWIGKKCI